MLAAVLILVLAGQCLTHPTEVLAHELFSDCIPSDDEPSCHLQLLHMQAEAVKQLDTGLTSQPHANQSTSSATGAALGEALLKNKSEQQSTWGYIVKACWSSSRHLIYSKTWAMIFMLSLLNKKNVVFAGSLHAIVFQLSCAVCFGYDLLWWASAHTKSFIIAECCAIYASIAAIDACDNAAFETAQTAAKDADTPFILGRNNMTLFAQSFMICLATESEGRNKNAELDNQIPVVPLWVGSVTAYAVIVYLVICLGTLAERTARGPRSVCICTLVGFLAFALWYLYRGAWGALEGK